MVVSAEHVLDTERQSRRYRLLAVVLATFTIFTVQREVALLPALIWAFLFLFYTLLMGPLLSRLVRGLSTNDLVYLLLGLMMVDGGLVIALVHFTGGVTSITIILIPLFVIYHTTYWGYRSGLASATLFAILYFGETILAGESIHPGLMLGQVALIYLLAMLSAHLASRLARAQAQRELLRGRISAVGTAHGVEVDEVTISGNTASLAALAVDESAVARFVDALREMPELASARLEQTAEAGASPGSLASFAVAVKVR
jgi:hypothetical protein